MNIKIGYDPQKLSDVGWGVLLATGADRRIRTALEPLISLRKEQAKGLLRIFEVQENETPQGFLARHGMGLSLADPQKIPYYLLIVANPTQVSFAFQSQLSIQYAVGRLWFDDPDAFATYVASVVRAELDPQPTPSELFSFSPTHEGDSYTAFTQAPAAILSQSYDNKNYIPTLPPDWRFSHLSGIDAQKARLIERLAVDAPRLVLAAGHSLIYPPDSAEGKQNQGSLVCSDWQGLSSNSEGKSNDISFGLIHTLNPTEYCFGAQDVAADWDLTGRMFVFYGSYSLGTPHDELAGYRQPFLAVLPQRLLSLPNGGALGFFGWVDRVWGYNDISRLNLEIRDLTHLLVLLSEGQPAGLAADLYSRRYAELAARVAQLRADYRYRAEVAGRLAEAWVGMNNAHGMQFFGDPAVRLLVDIPQAQVAWQTPTFEVKTILPEIEPAKNRFTNLELVFSRLDPDGRPREYDIRMHITWPAGSKREVEDLRWRATFNLTELSALRESPNSYAEALSSSLFSGSMPSTSIKDVTTIEGEGLRITITIDASAADLHGLAWELLKSPWDQAFLLQDSKVALKKQVQLIRRPAQRPILPSQVRHIDQQPIALVAISSPDLKDVSFRRGERVPNGLQLPRQVLENLAEVYIQSGKPNLSEQSFIEWLHKVLVQGFEILYLVAPSGLLVDRENPKGSPRPVFLFIAADGQTSVVEAKHLASRLASLSPEHRPRLIVLVPPEQPTNEPLGVGLLEAASSFIQGGVSAVVTFQDAISIDSLDVFLRVLFSNLATGTTAEWAVAQGRAAIKDRPDWWVPVLYASHTDSILWMLGEPEPTSQLPPANLKIHIIRSGIADYTVSLDSPLGEATDRLRLDFNSLRATTLSQDVYGKLLYDAIISTPSLQGFWKDTLSANYLPDYQGLQVLVDINSSAKELHEFAWETLYDFEGEAFLAMDETLAFYRIIASQVWQNVELAPRGDLKMLLAIAEPPREGQPKAFKFSSKPYFWNPEKEAELARHAAGGFIKESIDLRQEYGSVNLETLKEGLFQGCDIFLLGCASVLGSEVVDDPSSPRRLLLALDSQDGRTQTVDSGDLVELFRNLASRKRPRLVILAGADTASFLGPRLSEMGIPVVVGMQRNIQVKTFQSFLPIFFAELARDGNAGRAMAVARSILRDQLDWQMLVLYSRMTSGARLWR